MALCAGSSEIILPPRTARTNFSSVFRSSDGQQKGAILQSFHVVRERALQRQHVPSRQINHLRPYMHSDMACDSLDRNSTGSFTFVKARIRFQDCQYHAKNQDASPACFEFRPPCHAFSPRNRSISTFKSNERIGLSSGACGRMAAELADCFGLSLMT